MDKLFVLPYIDVTAAAAVIVDSVVTVVLAVTIVAATANVFLL